MCAAGWLAACVQLWSASAALRRRRHCGCGGATAAHTSSGRHELSCGCQPRRAGRWRPGGASRAALTALEMFSGTVMMVAAMPARKSACGGWWRPVDAWRLTASEGCKVPQTGGRRRQRRQVGCQRSARTRAQSRWHYGTSARHRTSQPAPASWQPAHNEPLAPLVAAQPADAGQERLEPAHATLRHLAFEHLPCLPSAVHRHARAWDGCS